MAEEAVRQEFEKSMAVITSDKGLDFRLCENPSCRCGTHYKDETTAWAWTAYWAAYLSGERAMREKAADFASHKMANELAQRIRALPLSAPQEKSDPPEVSAQKEDNP